MEPKEFTDTYTAMAESLMNEAKEKNVDLSGLTIDNFSSYLDEQFNDGGEVRCEKFTDLAWEYSINHAEFASDKFDSINWECTKSAIRTIQHRLDICS